MKYNGLEIVSDALSIVAESPVWDEKRKQLHYVDIQGKRLRSIDYYNSKVHDMVLNQQTGCIILDENGDFIAAMEDGVYRIDRNGNAQKISKAFEMEGFRFNDGKAGPDGRFYLGTISRERKGAFYRMEYDGSMVKLLGGIGNANGLDWDTDKGIMYFNDTPTLKTDVFDFECGEISNRRTICEYKNMGNPDGMTMDSEGMLWVCLWGEGLVVRLDPNSGEIIGRIELPVPNAACCIFGGDDMRDLIITTASHFTDLREYPLAGSVFKIRTQTEGRSPYVLKTEADT